MKSKGKKPLEIYASGKKIAPKCFENPQDYLTIDDSLSYWQSRLESSQSTVILRHARDAIRRCKQYKALIDAGEAAEPEDTSNTSKIESEVRPEQIKPAKGTNISGAEELRRALRKERRARRRKRRAFDKSKKKYQMILETDRRDRQALTKKLRKLRLEKEAEETKQKDDALNLTSEQTQMLDAMRANHEAWSSAYRAARKVGPAPFREDDFSKDQLVFFLCQVRAGLFPLWVPRRAHWRDRGLTYVNAHSMISWVSREKFVNAGFDPIEFRNRALGRSTKTAL